MTALSEDENLRRYQDNEMRREGAIAFVRDLTLQTRIDELEEDNAWLTNLLADLRTENQELQAQLDVARSELDVANARVSAGKMAP